GREVIYAPVIRAELSPHAAIFGSHDLVFKSVDLPEGGRALIRQVAEPYPVHEYDYVTVSLISAFYPKNFPSIYAGLNPKPGRVYDVGHFSGKNIDLTVEWEEALTAKINGIDAEGFLTFDGKTPLSPRMYFTVEGGAHEGVICFGPGQIAPDQCPAARKLELHDMKVHELEQLPRQWPRQFIANDFDWNVTGTTPEGALVTIDGTKLGYWTDYFGGHYDAEIVIEKAGPLAGRLSDGVVNGKNLWLRAGVEGPALAPMISLGLRDADIEIDVQKDAPPLRLTVPEANAAFDLATFEGTVDKTVARGAGGEMGLSASFSLDPYSLDLYVGITKPIQVGAYLPLDVRQLAGTTLEGRLHAFGDQKQQRIDITDVSLGRARLRGTLYRSGFIDPDNPDKLDRHIYARNFLVALGPDTVTANGMIDFGAENFDFDLRYKALDAPRYLRHFGIPIVAQRVEGGAHVWGGFTDPRATTQLVAGGVPVVDRVDASLDYRRSLLTINNASTHSLGGNVSAHGRIALGREVRILDLQATAKDVQVSKLPGVGAVANGTLDARISGSGTPARFKADGTADVAGLDIAGDRYPRMHVEASTTPDGTQTFAVDVVREKGGELHATALHDRKHNLSGAVSLRGLPVETFGFLAPAPEVSPVGGTVDAELALGGSWMAPVAEGTVSLARSWAGQAFLGTGELRVEPASADSVRISGELFQGKLGVVGTLGTRAPYRADLSLKVRRLELDHFLPELAHKFGARGWVTGDVELHTALAGGPESRPSGKLNLTEVVLYLESEDPQGRPAHIMLRNKLDAADPHKNDVAITWDGVRAALDHPVVFAGPAGDIEVSGSGTDRALALKLHGDVAVKMLAPYLREYFDDMDGIVGLAVEVTGPPSKPVVQGTVDFEDVSVRLAGQDATVSVPTGKITVTNSQVAITDLTVRMVDEFSDERAELKVRGGVGMTDFKPNVWALQGEGQLGGKMLLAVAPKVFSAASGMAYVNVWLRGPGVVPEDIDGTLWFRCPRRGNDEREDYALVGKRCKIERPLTLQMRGGGGHEVSLHEGRVRFAPDEDREESHLLILEHISGYLDDEGHIESLEGEAGLHQWHPEDFDVRLTATGLPLRVPGSLDITANVRDLRVVGSLVDEELDLTGKVELVDGRYIKKFNLVKETLLPERTTEVSTPIWETNKMIGNARLDLDLDVRSFSVQNNLANIDMAGDIEITGTPRDPRLEGEIVVNQGRFSFPGLRATFTRTSGQVTFKKNYKFPSDTPSLNIAGEADFHESNGREHVIHLKITGPLGNINWDLYTDTGLNKAQTTALLLAGRTSDELRQQTGLDPGGINTDTGSASQNEGNVYDELVKDLAGDFISLLVEDKLRAVTGLDVVRIEIGTTSVGLHLEKEVSSNLKVLGNLEKGIRAFQLQGGGSLRLTNDGALELDWSKIDYASEAEEDQKDLRIRAVLRRSHP
ncbi:MAG TPA: translocation/assembly module TamB domain-containing protein, partial [Kofleriaceae bacterium]|nr:translocation/assembly module TamB domain-containing protein [Kofleriaceae bacterium]